MTNLIERINKKIKKDGLGVAALQALRVGTQYATTMPARMKRQYKIENELPERIKIIKEVLSYQPELFFEDLRKRTLSYIGKNNHHKVNPGAYSYKLGGPPLLYASAYAALTLHIYNEIENIPDADKVRWIQYFKDFQCEDGLFRDTQIACPLADEVDWWGWRHLTLHVLMALTSLGGQAEKSFSILKPFKKNGFMTSWLVSRNWQNDPASVSNEVQNYATMLQYARDFQKEAWCNDVLLEMYDWLDKMQDSQTGLWGHFFEDPVWLSNGVQTGYHLWLLYFYDNRPIQYIERIIDSCLKTQNIYGGFGVPLNSSACEDIDSIDPLVRLGLMTEYRRDDIIDALKKALPWVLANFNQDGGGIFRRLETFQYGHNIMHTKSEESSMFPTWFRTLTLAYLSKLLADNPIAGIEWQFVESPGLQFWHDPDR